ncbi:dimethylsulfonioproprionate lyase family protein [Dongia sp.]|uniref:dimethylsulfonioproprionate lyase family protein n=1 Tax=Dongia sp. TaxID=1977262 RepID=UPI0035B4C9B4
MRREDATLFHLTETIDRHLAQLPAMSPGIADVRAALGAFRGKIGARGAAPRRTIPACGHLEQALTLTRQQSGAALGAAIAAALPELDWISYDAYPAAEIGAYFPKQHAFASLASLYDPAYALDFDLGLLLIAPHTLYRDHRHKAAELYLPLTGPTRWRFGIDAPWEIRQTGEPVWNPPQQLHATLVDDVPLLCLYAWTKDVHEAAQVVPAPDWAGIEADLAGR